MTVMYQNSSGKGTKITGIVHLQNIDNCHFIALLENGRELTLRVSGIEGIYYENIKEEN